MLTVKESYLTDKETPPYCMVPGAFNAEDLRKFGEVSRFIISIIEDDSGKATRFFQSSHINNEDKTHRELIYQKVLQILTDYPSPKYDACVGTGTIRTFIDGMHYDMREWQSIVVENLEDYCSAAVQTNSGRQD